MKAVLLPLLAAMLVPSVPARSQGSLPTLDSLRDKRRVLLVFSNGNNQLAAAQLAVAAEHSDGFRERDLLLAGLSGTDKSAPSTLLAPGSEAAARKRFHVGAGEFTVILIGKDGGEKMRSHQPIPWERLQSTIDAMPMRRDEMHR